MKTIKMTEDTAGQDIAAIYESLQQERENQLDALHGVVLAGRALMQVEARRLQQKSGTDNARTQGALQSIEQGYQVARCLEVETEIAHIRTGVQETGTTAVHGRVTDAWYRGLQNVQIRFADTSGKAIPGVPPIPVDVSGYFSADLTTDQLKELKKVPAVLLTVVSGDTVLVPASGGTFVVERGTANYREVVVNDAELDSLRPRIVVASVIAATPAAGGAAKTTTKTNKAKGGKK